MGTNTSNTNKDETRDNLGPINCLTLFNEYSFVIPLYQRSYDWEVFEIDQLIYDIKSVDEVYYLGNIIVNQRNDEYEVIDGQQRITTLWLLLLLLNKFFPDDTNAIKNIKEKYPKFKAREKSKDTFVYLTTLPKEKNASNTDGKYDNNIICAYNIIFDYLKNGTINNDVLQKLKKTKLFIIKVPEHTDLNRYFETMNNRGIQLNQTDIVKGHLFNSIDDKYKKICSDVWNACSNMDEYFQKNLDAKIKKIQISANPNEKLSVRSYVLGENWKKPSNLFNKEIEYNNENNNSTNDNEFWKGLEEYKENNSNDYDKNYEENEEIKQTSQHFVSIVSFEYLLLIVLKITFPDKKILFDDKKIVKQFNDCFKFSPNTDNQKTEQGDKKSEFFNNLVKARYLFDNYIVKRTYTRSANKTNIGWGIFQCSKGDNKCLTFKHDITNNSSLDFLEKIQSCLKVSYPGPHLVEWVYNSLELLINESKNSYNVVSELIGCCEKYAKNKIINYLDNSQEKSFCNGASTPKILFNYLDYLIYKIVKESKESKEMLKAKLGVSVLSLENFSFEYRNSVEHWHPQNPLKKDQQIANESILNNFGNLALVTTSQNSKFSNFMPKDKANYLSKSGANYSLKLRIMLQLTKDMPNNQLWMINNKVDAPYNEHCFKMINLLMSDIGCVCLGQSCEQCQKIWFKNRT